jgi:lysozyme
MKVAELGAKALGFWTMLSEPRRAVIISMVFQMGLDGVSRFIKMRAAIMREDWEAVFKEMLNSKWAKQTPGRAGRHAEQMRTGKWLDVYTKTP